MKQLNNSYLILMPLNMSTNLFGFFSQLNLGYLYTHVHGSVIHKRQEVVTARVSMDRGVDRLSV